MESRLQTGPTDQNREDFFKKAYPQCTKPKSELVQLHEYKVSSFILADCCGWRYKELWPDLNILGLETLYCIKDYNLEQDKYQGIIDNRDYANIKWPSVKTNNCALIFDQSAVMKYRTVDNLIDVLSTASLKYQPSVIVFRSITLFIDDSRLGNRFENLSKINIPNYVVTDFVFHNLNLSITFKKKVDLP